LGTTLCKVGIGIRFDVWSLSVISQSKEETFDWFKGYAELKELLNKILPNKQDRILMLGCGNSALSEEMYADGYSSIDNVDFSETVIKQMRERTVGQTGLRWHVMDISELKFEDETFDVVLDKGTMDALMCERGDVWSPSEELCREVAREVDEVVR
jgi:2-polyprenyl-3-methyl-5-hydroxy-6-metoxy-1,4-benzoquinol methylase